MLGEKIKVYERIRYNRVIKDEPLDWKGPFDKNILELAGLEIVEERQNGSNEYIVQKKEHRFT